MWHAFRNIVQGKQPVPARWGGTFSRQVATTMAGTIGGYAILLVSIPILTRLYSPEVIGTWQTFISFAVFLGSLLNLRYEVAIMLPEEEGEAVTIAALCIMLSATLAAVALIGLMTVSTLLGRLSISGVGAQYFPLVSAVAFGLAVEQTCTYWLTRNRGFVQLAVSRVARAAALVSLQVALLSAYGAHAQALIVASLAAQLLVTGWMFFSAFAPHRNRLKSVSVTRISDAMKTYRTYPMHMAPYSLVSQASKPLVLLLLHRYHSGHVVGYFAMSLQLVMTPITLFANTLNQVFYPKLAREYHNGQLDRFVIRLMRTGVIVCAPALVIFWWDGVRWLEYLLGPRWSGVGQYALPLSVSAFVFLFTAWLDRTFDVLGRQRLAVTLQVAYDVVAVGVLFYLLHSGVSAPHAIAAYAGVTALYNIIWLIVTFKIARFPVSGLVGVARLFAGVITVSIVARWLIGRIV